MSISFRIGRHFPLRLWTYRDLYKHASTIVLVNMPMIIFFKDQAAWRRFSQSYISCMSVSSVFLQVRADGKVLPGRYSASDVGCPSFQQKRIECSNVKYIAQDDERPRDGLATTRITTHILFHLINHLFLKRCTIVQDKINSGFWSCVIWCCLISDLNVWE